MERESESDGCNVMSARVSFRNSLMMGFTVQVET